MVRLFLVRDIEMARTAVRVVTRHASVFSTNSDTQAVPAMNFHCIRMFKGIFSKR